MWYGSTPSNKQREATEPAQPSAETVASSSPDVQMPLKDTDEVQESKVDSAANLAKSRSSGWSFWTKDATQAKPQDVKAAEATIGLSDTTKTAKLEPDSDVDVTKKNSIKIKPPKNDRLKEGALPTVEDIITSGPLSEPQPAHIAATKQLQKLLPNQVIPHFEDTYALEESPSILHSLGRLLHFSRSPQYDHVSRVRDPPRIKHALAIGVHGYFPAPLIRSVLGQPTGTSIRFSNMAAESIQKWTAEHGYSCEVEKIALEGEGHIAERVVLLWNLLLNWMEAIRKADFILIACHSQGVPVSIMLIAKLIAFGCINATRVGICAMAGVNMGPFSSYRSRWISGSAGELFEFELPFSKVSKDYETALKCAIEFGVRISYVGSIDDQLVSLEVSSSACSCRVHR